MDTLLTDTQKKVAVRMVCGQSLKEISKEFGVPMHTLAAWIGAPAFFEYKAHLMRDNREKVMQYLQSKQMKMLQRLEDIAMQRRDLKVARQAAVDVLGFSGLESSNVPQPPLVAVGVGIGGGQQEQDIDNELEEVDVLIADAQVVTEEELA